MYINLNKSNTYNLAKLVYHSYVIIQPSNSAQKSNAKDKKDASMNRKLKLINGRSHEEIWACTWQLEDTESALRNFNKYGLLGPTKFEDVDECYLRLFGFLSCIFMQKDAVVELTSILMPARKKKVAELFRNNNLVQLRNRLASHNVSNVNDKRTSILSQSSLLSKNMVVHYVTDKSYEVDLRQELQSFQKLLNEELIKIIEYMNEHLIDVKSENHESLQECLAAIKHRMHGGMVAEKMDSGFILFSSDPKYAMEEE